jgi:NTE family protein
MIENLAIKGGGIKGVAYVGALEELDKANLFQSIKRVSGTSAGALMASMICVGYTVTQIKALMMSIEFKMFESGWNPFKIFTRYGVHHGQYILDFAQKVVSNSPLGLTTNATFEDLQNKGGKELFVFSCNTSMRNIIEFSFYTTPKVIIAEAIRASMSIPYYFKAWKFSNNLPDEHLYVDGGIAYNYPLSFYDDNRFNTFEHVNFNSIGLFLHSKETRKPVRLKYNKLFYFSKELFEALLSAQDFIILKDREQMQRSILIDDLGFSATDFKMSKENLERLMQSGRDATIAYLQQKNWIQSK